MADYQLTATNIIIRTFDGASIPNDPANRDRIEYDVWVAKGNVPDSYVIPSPTPQQIRITSFLNDLDRQVLMGKLTNATPDQIKTYVTANVTDLASARLMLTKIILILAIVANQ